MKLPSLTQSLAVVTAGFLSLMPHAVAESDAGQDAPWTFVSIPDFLNVDTLYPQPGWEDALSYSLKAVKAENPDFVLVPGDLVMGRWETAEGIKKYAATYYPAWIKRMQAHGLKYYTAIGDHEIGDNPWRGAKVALVPNYKQAFVEYLKMPQNGPEHMLGTAFYFTHKNALVISVDVFEQDENGEVHAGVTGKQLAWLEEVLEKYKDIPHKIIMGHTPVLGPVRKKASSGLMTEKGRESAFWQTMARHKVDLYLCGEVHAITSKHADGVEQISHGGLYGYNPTVNYLVAKIDGDRIELELKELVISCTGEKLWQPGHNRPHESVIVPEHVQKQGYRSVGRLVLKHGQATPASARFGYFNDDAVTAALATEPIYSDDFDGDLSQWQIEQMPGGKTRINKGKLEINDAAGCTIWFKKELSGPVLIEYDATVLAKPQADGKAERFSDLNCFWMAQDLKTPDLLAGSDRGGNFANYHPLALYYVGYGGNRNSSTRFRRYPGDGTRPLLPENDLKTAPHLLKKRNPVGSGRLKIQLIASGSDIQFRRNDEVIFSIVDPDPLRKGWFGIRTVNSHIFIDNFRVYQLADGKE
ncbi:MAG: metallophosphoesterase [Akkermansiaceae bacterium]|nr:metallophosphoesterase [Akkermansiaceae bacterium]